MLLFNISLKAAVVVTAVHALQTKLLHHVHSGATGWGGGSFA